jgi:hypothetical protein
MTKECPHFLPLFLPYLRQWHEGPRFSLDFGSVTDLVLHSWSLRVFPAGSPFLFETGQTATCSSQMSIPFITLGTICDD